MLDTMECCHTIYILITREHPEDLWKSICGVLQNSFPRMFRTDSQAFTASARPPVRNSFWCKPIIVSVILKQRVKSCAAGTRNKWCIGIMATSARIKLNSMLTAR